jgi:hypothetical protein
MSNLRKRAGTRQIATARQKETEAGERCALGCGGASAPPPPIKQKLAVSVSDNEAMGGHAAHFNEELEQIDAAIKAVEALLPALDRPPIKPWLGNDPIRFIADLAQQAWASTNDIPPVSKGSEDPLARLVTGALALVHIGWSIIRWPTC